MMLNLRTYQTERRKNSHDSISDDVFLGLVHTYLLSDVEN